MAINPLQPPIQYGMEPQDPGAAMLEGLRIGEVFRQRRQMREQQQLAEQYRADASAYYANPTPQGALELARKYPEQGAAFMQEYRALDQEKQNNLFDRVARVVSAMAAGRNDVALQQADQEILAAKESGRDTSSLENIKFALETDPDNAYGPVLQILSVMNPPRAEKLMESLTKSAQATVEAGTSEARITAATAEATLKDIQSRYEEDRIKSEIDKNIAARVASGEAVENAKTAERQKFESDLRAEYVTGTKGFDTVLSAYEKIIGTSETAAGDQALIYNFMKMLDPTSAVLPGEYATAQNAGSVPARLWAAYNKAIDGTILEPQIRKDYIEEARKIAQIAEKGKQKLRTGITRIGQGAKLNIDNIFYETSPQSLSTRPQENADQSQPTVGDNNPDLDAAMRQHGGR